MGSQPESKLSRTIMSVLRARGAFAWKNHGGPTMMAGLPDIAVCYRGRFIGIETKMPGGGQPTPIQQHRHDQIRESGGSVIVARAVTDVTTWLDRIDTTIERGSGYTPPTTKTPQRPSGRAARVAPGSAMDPYDEL